MKRPFTIGERVFDAHDNRWATVLLIAGADHDDCVEGDCVILVRPDTGGEDETTADDLYKIAPGKTFRGAPVCWEHNSEIDYPYFCPDEYENCYSFELDGNNTGKKKYTFRFWSRAWADITVCAEDEETARTIAAERYDSGDYDQEDEGFENTDCENITEDKTPVLTKYVMGWSKENDAPETVAAASLQEAEKRYRQGLFEVDKDFYKNNDWLEHAHILLDERFPEADEAVKDDFACEHWQNASSDTENCKAFEKYQDSVRFSPF